MARAAAWGVPDGVSLLLGAAWGEVAAGTVLSSLLEGWLCMWLVHARMGQLLSGLGC